MSKTNVRRPQKKVTIKKRNDWDSSVGDLSQYRLSDDEASRRKQSYQSKNLSVIHDEKQRKLLAKAVHDARKNSANQLGILREILFNERDVDELMQRSTQVLQTGRSDKFAPKSSILRTGKNHFTSLTNNRPRKSSTSSATRPPSTRNLNSPSGAGWNHSDDERGSISSAEAGEADDDELENEPVRLSRPTKKVELNVHDSSQVHLLNDRDHSSHRHSQTRLAPSTSQAARPNNNTSILSDFSKAPTSRTNQTDSNNQLKTLLERLSTELNELESITGFKSEKNDSASNTCSTALVNALLHLTGHVKQSAIAASKGQSNNDMHTLKEQLSVVVKAQLDFQHKVENQVSMLQTMMQTVCQLVNNELMANRKAANQASAPSTNVSTRVRRDSSDFQNAEPRPSWSHQNSTTRQNLGTKKTNSDDFQNLTSRLSNTTPVELSVARNSFYTESQDPSKKISRPASVLSNNENNGFDFLKQIGPRRNNDFDSRLTMISPIDLPASYDAFESGLPKSNSTTSMMRTGISASSTTNSMNPTSTTTATNETILEKILQERLILVQQIAELNKQHEMTQEELANLEANASKQRPN